MSYTSAINTEVDVLHVVRNLLGTATVTGQAGNITIALRAPAGAAHSITPTITEQGATGYYDAKFTPNVLGVWRLTLTNPAGTDEGVYDYDIDVVQDAAGTTPTGTFLTTLQKVKDALEETGTTHDTYITDLIARGTHLIEKIVGRTLVAAAYTEYAWGRGGKRLELRRGPINSVTSVEDVTYDAVAAETLTTVQAGDYFARSLASEGSLIPGWLERHHGTWLAGQRNYRVVYNAGFSTVPFDLEQACIETVIWMLNQRKSSGFAEREVEDERLLLRAYDVLHGELRTRLASYRDWRVAA